MKLSISLILLTVFLLVLISTSEQKGKKGPTGKGPTGKGPTGKGKGKGPSGKGPTNTRKPITWPAKPTDEPITWKPTKKPGCKGPTGKGKGPTGKGKGKGNGGTWTIIGWSDWSRCNVTCGGGFRRRDLYCMHKYGAIRVCSAQQATCNLFPCEINVHGPWSNCSGKCIKDEGQKCRNNLITGNKECISCNRNPCKTIKCGQADLFFVLDSSASIGQMNWYRVKQFVIDVTKSLELGPESTRVAIISYATYVNLTTTFGNFTNQNSSLENHIWSLEYMAGATATADSLKLMQKVFQYDSRSDAKKIAIILTDGKSNILQNETILEAKKSHLAGIETFAIGVGAKYDLIELVNLASAPSSNHTFRVQDFEDLTEIVQSIINSTCKAASQIKCLPWEGWTKCSAKCGGGYQTRWRHCYFYNPDRQEYTETWRRDTRVCNSQQCITTTAIPTTTEAIDFLYCHKCQWFNNLCFKPHPSNCSKYLMCVKLIDQELCPFEIHILECPTNHYWDPNYLSCSTKPQWYCSGTAQTSPMSRTTTARTTIPASSSTTTISLTVTPCPLREYIKDNTKFWYNGFLASCPTGQTFNQKSCACINEAKCPMVTGSPKCPLTAYIKDNRKFCHAGYLMNCAPGTIFSQKQCTCIHDLVCPMNATSSPLCQSTAYVKDNSKYCEGGVLKQCKKGTVYFEKECNCIADVACPVKPPAFSNCSSTAYIKDNRLYCLNGDLTSCPSGSVFVQEKCKCLPQNGCAPVSNSTKCPLSEYIKDNKKFCHGGFIKDCAPGTVFSLSLCTCVWPETPSTDKPTVGCASVINPSKCPLSEYIKDNKKFCHAGFIKDCAPGTIFSLSLCTCIWPPQCPPNSGSSTCPLSEYIKDNKKFCQGGFLKDCAPGTILSLSLCTCIWPPAITAKPECKAKANDEIPSKYFEDGVYKDCQPGYEFNQKACKCISTINPGCPLSEHSDSTKFYNGNVLMTCDAGKIFSLKECRCMKGVANNLDCDPNLLLYLPFDSDTTDNSCNKVDVVSVGYVRLLTGVKKSAAYFNGKSYFTIPFFKNFFAGGHIRELSVSVWFKSFSKKKIEGIVGNGNTLCSKSSFEINIGKKKDISATISSYTAEKYTTPQDKKLQFKNYKWTHLVSVYNDGKFQIYINGEKIEEYSIFKDPIGSNQCPLYIGFNNNNGNGKFNGYMDELRIYKKALNLEEIEDLYKK